MGVIRFTDSLKMDESQLQLFQGVYNYDYIEQNWFECIVAIIFQDKR